MRRRLRCRVLAGVAATLALLSGPCSALAEQGRAGMDGGHNPPLLVMAGEAVELRYDVICPATPCEGVEGTVYLRRAGDSQFQAVPLRQGGPERRYLLYAAVPPDYLRDGFDYYAAFQETRRGASLLLPSGGAHAPQHVWVFHSDQADVVALRHTFGATRGPAATVLRAKWGWGPDELGLMAGPDMITIGPASFDFAPDGSLVVLDQVNRRAVRVASAGRSVVPLDISAGMADLAVEADGSLHVLESAGAPGGGNPLLRAFSPDGRLLASGPIAERTADMIRAGPTGAVVHQYPSDVWMPMGRVDPAGEGAFVSARDQARRARPGRPVRGASGGRAEAGDVELLVKATDAEARVALVDGDRVLRVWRLVNQGRPAIHFGEVQLAEVVDGDLLLVVRVWTEDPADSSSKAEFRVLRVAEFAVQDYAVETAEWAETSPVSRFRLGPDGLYQMRSSPAGAEVVRFAIGR